MAICVVGINHKTASLDIRERFTVAEHDYQKHLADFITAEAIDSAVVLSTCNRTEYYLSTQSIKNFKAQAQAIMNLDVDADYVYFKSEQACASHLFAVTAGVDSLVLGETQIQGQVKRAFDEATKTGVNGEINKLFQMAFKTAKLVRSDTEIGRNPVSVAHCAVQLGRQIYGSLSQQKVLIVGAGETAELLIRYLINHDARDIVIANRTAANAQKLSQIFNLSTIELGLVPHRLAEFDLIFTATASDQRLIKYQDTEVALKKRKYKPMVMIDLSVPRDIEERIKKIDDVFLYAVDDLEKVITENMQRRESTVEAATRIINAEAELLAQWLKSQKHHNLLKQYQQQITAIKEEVVAKQINAEMSEEQLNKINTTAHQLSKKLSHTAISGIRKVLASGNQEHIDLVAELFNLEINDDT